MGPRASAGQIGEHTAEMESREEARIIADILAGDVNAYARLVEEYQRPIFNLMLRMSGSAEDALDLSQEAFIKTYENLERFQPDRRFFSWLYAIAMNVARDFLRKRRPECLSSDDVAEGETGFFVEATQETEMLENLDAAMVYEAMDRLPPDYREALILRYREDLSLKEVAESVGVSLSGAKMRIQRGLIRIRELLAAKEK